MENKDNNSNLLEYGVGESNSLGSDDGLHQPPPDPNALSLDPEVQGPLISQDQPRGPINAFLRIVRRADVLLALFLILSMIGVFVTINRTQQQKNITEDESDRFGTVQLPLDEIVSGKNLTLAGAANVTINGPMQLNDALMLTPSLQPTGAKAGQIYYDQGSNQLAYFNGEQFVFLTGADPQTGGVQSLGGATGQLTLGSGLSLTEGQLANSGVISVQGQQGDVTFTAGAGITINGTNFSNSGVISIAAGSPNVTVNNDGSGNVTISVEQPVAGTGTVTSSGSATAGHIPLFTTSQNIEDSIITQSGLTVTISGDLSVVTGGLTLSNALTVSNGGTGASSLANNGILVGNGTAPVSSVAAGGAGLCLLSTAGAPVWAACPSASGVTSLNGLNGALSIANASGAGNTITIDDASTATKGIASFNSLNFTATGGAVNTVQNIDTTATPTFAGVNTNNITPSGALTVGISAQTALLQGSTTTITSNGVGNNIVLNSAGTIELQDNTNVTGSISTSGDMAVNGGDITSSGALNITPGGTLTVGTASQTLTLQGGAATSFRATSGANTTIIGFTNPVANTTLNFPALAAGTYTICTTSGNCSGAATTLQGAYDNSSNPEITLDAARGALTIRDNATPIGGNLFEVQNNAGSATYLAVTASGVAVTGTATVSGNINATSGALQTGGTTRIDNSGNAVNIANITLSGTISGGTTITGSGNINSSGGSLQTNGTTRVDNSGNLVNIAALTASGSATFQGGSVTLGTNAQAGSIVLNDGSSNTGTIQLAALGQNTVYTLPDPGTGTATICLTTGNCAGSGGGVTTGGGSTNRLAKFTGTQAVGDSTISDDGTNVTVSVDVIIQGGDLTVGTTSQAASIVLNDGNGQTTTLQAGNSTGDITFILPTNTGTANQCLKQSGAGNQLIWQDCDGGSGGSSATLQTAYNNSTSPEIVLNSSVGGLTIRDNSTPIGGNLFEIQNNLGSTTYLGVTVSGVSVTGTNTATGNINSSGGALQTGGTTRIDNSGNAVNIGNITGSGAMTIASVGAGNDITIDGADQFIVQDGAVFNALSTFNANIDIGANDIVGTTADINLTNFDVIGATGNVTAGTYNGQTISSSANFTGTVAIATDATIGGDIAVNGGDITSSGALNITPGGTLTAGVTGQQLILQGNANTRLTATGGGFTTTVGFTGTPTGAVNYNFDRAAAAGTYTICTTIGNCAGSGGGVTTSGGTTGAIAKFTGAQTLGDSLLSESGSTVTVNGNLNLVSGNQFQVNGTQISSANLSNDANLAKLSASQTFTGNTVSFVNGSNSTNAFNIQNASGNRVLTVDTTNAQVALGVGSVLDGKLVFSNMTNNNTVTIVPGTPTSNRTLTLPDASGIICTDSGNCAGAGATLQTAYNFSTGGTTPKIKVNNTLGGVDIQDADTTIAANLFNIRESNAAGLGSVMFGVGSTGQTTLQNAANSTSAFRLLTQGGTSVLAGDTTNGRIVLGQSSTLSGTIVFNNATNANTVTLSTAAATGNRTITLPDESGTVCIQGSASCGFALSSGGNNYIQNQNASSQTADFRINGSGRADTAFFSPSIRAITDSTTAIRLQNAGGSATALTVDTTNSRIGIGGSFAPQEALDVIGNFQVRDAGTATKAYRFRTSGGALDFEGAGTNLYMSVWSNPDFTGTQRNYLVFESGANIARAVGTWQFRTDAEGTTRHVIDGTTGASVVFNQNGEATNFSVQGDTDASLMYAQGSTDRVGIGTNAPNYKLDVAGDVNTTTQYRIGGTVICTTSGCTPAAGSGNYIQNQNSTDQTGNFRISGTGRANTSLQTPLLDTASAVALNIGTTNATSINLNKATNVTGDMIQVGLQPGQVAGNGTNASLSSLAAGKGGNTTGTTGQTAGNGGSYFLQGGDGGNAPSGSANGWGGNVVIAGGAPGSGAGSAGFRGNVILQGSGGTVAIGTFSPNTSYKLDVAGDINISTGSSYRINGVSICTSSGCTPAAGSANYIQNQNSSDQSADFRISGTGRANTSIQTPLLDTASAAALNIGTTNATGINLNKSTTVTGGLIQSGGVIDLAGNAASTIRTTSGGLDIRAFNTNTLTLNTSGAGTVNVGTDNTTAINLGGGNDVARTIRIGNPASGTAAQTVSLGSQHTTSTTLIQGGNGASAIMLSPASGGSITAATTGAGITLLSSDDLVAIRSTVDNDSAFQVQNAGGGFVMNVDTLNGDIDLGFLNVSYPSFGDVLMDTNFGSGDIFLGTSAAASITLGRSGITTGIIGGLTQNTGPVSLTGNAASSFTTSAGALTLTGAAASTWSTTAGNLTIQAATTNTLALQTAGAGTVAVGDVNSTTINIGRGSNIARTINIGNAGTSTAQAITIGSTGSTSSTLIQGGTGATAISLTAGTNGNINATTAGTGDILLTSNSQIIAKSSNNSATAFQIQNATNVPIFNVDTFNARIGVNNDSPETSVDVVGTIQQTGLLTSDTQAGDATEWTKMATCTITFQFGSCNTVINILGGNDGTDGDNTQATVSARVKQQNALGGVPYVDVTLNGVAHLITKDDIKAVTTVNNGTTTTVELWGRINQIFEHWTYTPVVNTDGADFAPWVWNQQSGFQPALPAGTQTAATYGATYADSLSVTPAANTATAFQVLNASAVPTFSIDNTTSRVYVGNPTADATGALLVLDTKNTAGDPTGPTDMGAMYYSTTYAAMRCYQDNSWSNCSDPTRMARGYNIQEEFLGASNGQSGLDCNGGGSARFSAAYAWDCYDGGLNSLGIVQNTTADSYLRPGQIQLSTGASVDGNSSMYLTGGATSPAFLIGGGETFETAINIPTLSNGTQGYVIRAGLCDVNNAAQDCNNGVYFEYESATSVNWRYAVAEGGTRTKASSTKAAATGWTNLKFVATANNSVTFYVKNAADSNYVNIGTATSANVPDGTVTTMMFLIDKTVGSGSSSFKVDYVDYWNNYTSRR